MGFYKNCDYSVPFVLIPTDKTLQGLIMCGEYEEFLSIPEKYYNRYEKKWEYPREDPHIVRGITWNNTHFLPILSRERHCKLPILGNNYYEGTESHEAYQKLMDEFKENNYGRVTKYLYGEEAIPNKQAPAHWFLNFKLWVIGGGYYERPFAKEKWGNFK